MNKLFQSLYSRISSGILRRMDEAEDMRICGQSLTKYVPSVFRDDKNGVGMTGSQSTHYVILNRVFQHVELTAQDCFLDVGCGKGRVLAFLIKKRAPCGLYGIEINEISGKVVLEWTPKYSQAHVTIGDAFQLDFNRYTVLFMGRPFLPKTFLQFIEKIESELIHPITLIYWVDQQSGFMLKDRPGWKMRFRETLLVMYGLEIARTPQSYSIWTYAPAGRAF